MNYKFDDEMAMEALLEAVDREEAMIRIVETLGEGRSYNACVVEGGGLGD